MPNKLECYITLGCKGLLETNTIAHWVHSYVKKKIKCCEYGPWPVIRLVLNLDMMEVEGKFSAQVQLIPTTSDEYLLMMFFGSQSETGWTDLNLFG